jgi:LPS export ABC transporter protein LptC
MTPFLKRHWPLAGIALLLLVASLYIFGAQESIEEEAQSTNMVMEKGIELMENISFTGGDPDKGERWVLNAKEVRVSDDQTVYSGIDFGFKLELRDGTHIELQGEKADYDSSTGEISLQGGLNGQTNKGYRIVTDQLFYKGENGYLVTDGPVKIFGPFLSVSGQGLYFNPEEEILRVLSDVTTLIDRKWVAL